MPRSQVRYDLSPDEAQPPLLREGGIESGFIATLQGLRHELKTLGVNPRRAMEQIVEYKNDPGNGYTRTLLCFLQLFIVSNRDRTYDAANNNARHFALNADTAMRGSAIQLREASLRSLSAAKDNRFLPVYEFADEDNKKITHLDDFTDRFLKKCDLGRTISRYMVLIVREQKLMIMRPYQVYNVMPFVDCKTIQRAVANSPSIFQLPR